MCRHDLRTSDPPLSRTSPDASCSPRGAVTGAALAFPLDTLAVRRRQPRDSVHCLPAADRFRPGEILTDCTFAAFAPDGVRVALETQRGIEILNRADATRATVTPPGFTLAAGAWHPDGSVLLASGPAADGSGPYLHAIGAAGVTRLLQSYPGQARAASFSPDGRRVAFTYLNRYRAPDLHGALDRHPVGEAAEPVARRSRDRAERRARHVRARVVRDARIQPRRRAPLLRVRPAGGDAQREHPLDRPRDRHPQPRSRTTRALPRARRSRRTTASSTRALREHATRRSSR